MAKPERVARQSSRPSGWLGAIVARVMALETAGANRFAVEQLSLRDGEAVLEIGCGHGRTLARIGATRRVFMAGIDASDVMIRLARQRLDRWLFAGRAELALATSNAIPYGEAQFDA